MNKKEFLLHGEALFFAVRRSWRVYLTVEVRYGGYQLPRVSIARRNLKEASGKFPVGGTRTSSGTSCRIVTSSFSFINLIPKGAERLVSSFIIPL